MMLKHPDAPACQGTYHEPTTRQPEGHLCGPDCQRCLDCGAGLCVSPATLEDNQWEDEGP